MRSHFQRAAATIACLALLTLGTTGPALGASVTFGTPTVDSVFGKGITFSQPYSGGSSFREVDIVVTYPGSIGPAVSMVEDPGTSSFTYEIDASEGQLQPNTRVTAHFEVIFSDGSTQDGPDISVTYADTRFNWRTKSGSIVKLHWYSGSDSFASQALQIADQGVAKAMAFMGAKSTKPIDFFVYDNESQFRDALGPAVRENVGGLANTTTRTLFALIAPGDMGYAQTVVPHELTHVIFDEITGNPYHYPPHWLNEAVAVYVSEGYGSYDRGLVSSAVKSGTLMPLAALGGQFPTSQAMFYLAYAESVAAVDFMIKKYGQTSVDKLLRAFGEGKSDDEAFTAALGIDLAAFDSEWMTSVGAKPVSSYGPQAAPTGPLPPGWTNTDGSVASPNPSTGVAASAGATSPPDASNESGGSSGPPLELLLLAAVLVMAVGLGAAYALMMRQSRRPPTDGS
jgi:hypothetical protein